MPMSLGQLLFKPSLFHPRNYGPSKVSASPCGLRKEKGRSHCWENPEFMMEIPLQAGVDITTWCFPPQRRILDLALQGEASRRL
jgi:hypothetical protein